MRNQEPKNIIDVPGTLELFRGGYALLPEELNFYTIRIRQEETNVYFDWYHTTGSLVKNKNGFCSSQGKIKDPESVAIYVSKEFIKEIIL